MNSNYKATSKNKETSAYDDGNIPEIDLPGASNATREIPSEHGNSLPKLPESERPRQDGPGGN